MNWDKVLYPLDLVGCNLFGRSFVGAFNIDGVLSIGRDLKKQGFGVTYNLLGEHVYNPRLVSEAISSTFQLIKRMSPENSGNVSCKPTLYGLAISKAVFNRSIEMIINFANAQGIEVEFDAENRAYVEDTFDVFSSFASREMYSNTVRQAVQAHLKDIIPLMDKYKLWDKNLRIVKGSGVYNESVGTCESGEDKIGQRYFDILKRNMIIGRTPFVATVRDRSLAESVIKITDGSEHQFEFQMLYGPLGRKLGKELLQKGYPVRIYIPFTDGWCRDEWKAYGLRRAKMMRNLILKNLRSSMKLG